MALEARTGGTGSPPGCGSLHGHWEIKGLNLTLQSAIEQFADEPGTNGRSRGGDEEVEEEEEARRR